jgi:transcriptional regulator with XRE-family HTH domain
MTNSLNIEKLNQRAEELGLNQAGIARKLEVTREAVSQWCKNEKFPRPDKLLKLARLLDLSFSELVNKVPTVNEPVVAFRKKAGRKISPGYLDQARDMGRILATLAPQLPFDDLSQPPFLKSPSTDYAYVQKAAKRVRVEIGVPEGDEVPFQKLINYFNDLHAVIIPVLWGNKENHENALHIYLPETMSTWIYLNLDCQVHDFKYWMSHELGHVYAPQLKGDHGEDFAEAFAAALLVPEELASHEYVHLRRIKNIGARINHIKDVADRLVVSPFTVYSEINNYASHHNKPKIEIATIHQATRIFNNQYKILSQYLFETGEPAPAQYIASARDEFGSPFFEILRQYVVKNRKSASFIQSILNIPIIDARNIYEELC